MEDSEILARFKHEEEMRERIAQDLVKRNQYVDAELKKIRLYDRWRWGVGIAVGVMLSRTPDGLEFIKTFSLFNTGMP